MFFNRFEKIIRKLCKIFYYSGAVLLFVLMIQSAADVVGRYIFNSPIIGTMERSQILVGAMIFLGWGYTQMEKGNVKVELFFTRFSPRTQTIVTLVTTSLSLILFGLMTWQALLTAKKFHESGRLVYVIHFPLAPFQLFVVLGALMTCLVLIIELINLIREKPEGNSSHGRGKL
jgi:TRAP-type transport system small permease protein